MKTFAALLCLVFSLQSYAQEESDELDSLNKEALIELIHVQNRLIETMQAQIAAQEERITTLERVIAAHEAIEPAEGDSADEGTGAVNDEEDPEEETRTFTSADQILRAIPEDLRPGRDGWDVVTRVEAEMWFVENIPGSTFEARMEVHQVAIRYNQTAEDWTVTVSFKYRERRYMNWDIEERLSSVSMRGDNDFATRARRLEEGARVAVTGTILYAGWGTVIGQTPDQSWKPTRYTINLEEATIRSPHLRQ